MGAVRHTRHTRARLIKEFRRTGRVDLAAAAAGCDRDSHYRWLHEDPEYKAEFEKAREQVAGLLEDELVRRAYHGTQRVVSVAGQREVITEFSDNLLMFYLEHRNPTVFRRQVAEQVSSATTINLVVMDAGQEAKPTLKVNGHPAINATIVES